MCEYCAQQITRAVLEDCDNEVYICAPSSDDDDEVLYTKIKINYCPICGRKLVKEEN